MKVVAEVDDVIKFYSDLSDIGVDIWIDGGWGVDALLNKQTRPHGDLDIVVREKDLAVLKKYFSDHGYISV